MLEVLVGAAFRSLLLATAVWLTLRLPGLRNRHVQLIAWTIVLAASLLMPVATRVAALVIPPSSIIVPDVDQVVPPHSAALLTQLANVAPWQMPPASTAVPESGLDDPAATADPRDRSDAASDLFDWRALASLVYAAVCGTLIARFRFAAICTRKSRRTTCEPSCARTADRLIRDHAV